LAPSHATHHSSDAIYHGELFRPNNQGGSDVSFFRHGWGCDPDPAEAVKYLSAAASNAASIEDLALQAGLKKGGAAKGELVLAIFELANCFRHGWGVQVDKLAAKQVRPLRVLDEEAS
jgi:TPR repeat protein